MILRICVVIPVFDNPATVAQVVRGALASCPHPILLVDDGSAIPVREILAGADIEHGSHSRVSIERFSENRGKGAALRRAIELLLSRGFTHMLTIDADGQHLPEEIPLLVAAAKRNPWALVIGNRRMPEHAPEISKFGRKFSNFWVRYQADGQVADSQSGFRIYPLFELQTMRFRTKRFDFEIEALTRAMWRGVPVENVEVSVRYQPDGERVSHFHKLRDNARITALNIALIVVSLLRRHREPGPAAAALGIGVLIGCTPFYGVHFLIAAAVAFFFRLNAVLLWIGTNISIPPLAPFLAYASIQIGARVLGQEVVLPTDGDFLGFAGRLFTTWLVGSALFGSALGLTVAVVAYLGFRKAARKAAEPPRNWTGGIRGGRFGNQLIAGIMRVFGLRVGYFCLNFVYPYFYIFAPKARAALDEYWHVIAPGMGWVRRQWHILMHMRVLSRVLLDKGYQFFQNRIAFEPNSKGFENIASAMKAGKGLFILGAHVGGGDVAATSMRSQGVKHKIFTLQHDHSGLTYAKVFGEKSQVLVGIIYVGEKQPAIYSIHQLVSNGDTLALLCDRPLDNNFDLVPFFGKLAPMATSPFRIALATGTEVVFSFGFKGKGMQYDYFAMPVKLPRAETHEEKTLAARDLAAQFARELERFLRAYPYQWFNFYRFFSLRPTLPQGGVCEPRRYHLEEELAVRAKAALRAEPDSTRSALQESRY